ncbi:helix-turn-helix transcriptional regulator [Luteitalea sp.]
MPDLNTTNNHASDTLLTLSEAAAHGRCSSAWISRLHRDGRLPALLTGGRGLRLFRAADVERLINEPRARRQSERRQESRSR